MVKLFTHTALLAGCSGFLASAISACAVCGAGPEDAKVHGAAALSVQPADTQEQGDATMSPAARSAIEQGPLPASADDLAAKAAANAAVDEAARAGKLVAPDCADLAPAGGPAPSSQHGEPRSQ